MFRHFIPTLALFLLTLGANAANLSWDPANGYQSDEVELSGLLPQEIQRVLDWMNSGRKAEEKKGFRKALRKYKRVHKKYPKSQYAPEALYRTSQIRLKQNKIDKAFDAFELIAYVYPSFGSFNDTIGEMYKIAVRRQENYRVKIFGVFPGFLNYDRAVSYFERIVVIAPYSDYAPLALMNVGQIWAKRKNETMAIYSLDRLITNYPRSFLTPDAYIQLASTHASLVRGPFYDQRNTEDAMTFFDDFLIQFPANNRVGEAEGGLYSAENVMALSKVKIGDFYFHKRANFHAAKVLYNEAITIAPKSSSADIAREKIAMIEAKEKKLGGEQEAEAEREAPTVEELEKKAEQRAKRKVLGIF
ncbi:MAG: outer membrane protein assembly factor BamD [Candidatus Pelagisphaera sp.]|jgi:outer membrane protein assembly factor BamD